VEPPGAAKKNVELPRWSSVAQLMESSIIRGIAFFGMLFLASFLLSPDLFLSRLSPRHQTWVVRRWTKEGWGRLTVGLAILVVILCTWLIHRVPQRAVGLLQKDSQAHSASTRAISVAPMVIRAWK